MLDNSELRGRQIKVSSLLVIKAVQDAGQLPANLNQSWHRTPAMPLATWLHKPKGTFEGLCHLG